MFISEKVIFKDSKVPSLVAKVKPFHAAGLYPLKTLDNQNFSEVFRSA